jgi:hypothetical protein
VLEIKDMLLHAQSLKMDISDPFVKGWRGGSEVRSTDCSFRGLGSVPDTHMAAKTICNSSPRGI